MCSVNRMVTLILVFLYRSLSGEVVFAQSYDSSGAKPAWDKNGLLPPKHNPASVPPADKPDTKDLDKLVPSVPMTSQTCAAICLFDASAESERYYNLVNCLDGLTFGFGNWPQGELG